MATYLFAWNPKLWPWDELPNDLRRLRRRGHFDTEWSAGRVRNIEVGSRAFFMRLGVPPKGIIGAGHTLTAPQPGLHWLPAKAANGIITQFLTLRLEAMHVLPIITTDDLATPPFSRFRWTIRASGVRIPTTLADALEDLWDQRLAAAAKTQPTSGGSQRRTA
jgi:5-methylcytosine-specific restriction protein A